jgi:hypothetical protein
MQGRQGWVEKGSLNTADDVGELYPGTTTYFDVYVSVSQAELVLASVQEVQGSSRWGRTHFVLLFGKWT